jgi:NADH-ubiquinone oxidoreductase chain 4
MILSILILVPLLATIIIFIFHTDNNEKRLKIIALVSTVINLFISLVIWFLFDNSSKYFQFIQEHYTVGHYDFYLGLDGLSIYFVLLTTLIAPLSIICNWKSINNKTSYFLVIILVLESALLLIYSVLDILMFYIFFESILAPLFILIGFFGSTDKLRASFYFFLYTFLGSLFMLLSIITVSSLTGCTDMDIIYKTDYAYITQIFLFMGIFVAFAVKTPVIFLNTWLLKAHVESPLSGSVILAAIVLKLSLYGVFRLILPLVPKAFIFYTHIIFVICVITILYASFSTIRTIDVKELIAYSSVSHAAVYFAGILSNVMQGIQGGIILGLAHGFVSSGLFISGGGVLYDRSSTRTINYYGGLAQVMPVFSILFFILCLGNCGAPLTLNFVGEFMSLYGIFERLSLAGILASSSIVLSAVYTIFMFNRIIFGGIFKNWFTYLPDLNKREYSMLLLLVLFTVVLGIYPSIILDTLNYNVSSLLFGFEGSTTMLDSSEPLGIFIQDNGSITTLFEISNIFYGFNINFLYIITSISILSGILIVITKNPIVSVLYLILLFSSISCYLIFVGIVFIGLSYLLVYVGAVSILFLFILMLINIRVSELIGDTNNNIPLAIIAILAFFIPISDILPSYENKRESSAMLYLINKQETQVLQVSSNNWDNNMVEVSDITSIGNIMYTSYFIWLIITSVILLLAMVGSIIITLKQKE